MCHFCATFPTLPIFCCVETFLIPVVVVVVGRLIFFLLRSRALPGPGWCAVSRFPAVCSLVASCFYCGLSYLPLREVEHCDEAKHLVGVVVITVFRHLSLLKGHQRDAWVGNALPTAQLNTPTRSSPWWRCRRDSAGWWFPPSLTCWRGPLEIPVSKRGRTWRQMRRARVSDQQWLSVPNLLQEFLDAVEVVVRNGVSLEVHDHFLSVKQSTARLETKSFDFLMNEVLMAGGYSHSRHSAYTSRVHQQGLDVKS